MILVRHEDGTSIMVGKNVVPILKMYPFMSPFMDTLSIYGYPMVILRVYYQEPQVSRWCFGDTLGVLRNREEDAIADAASLSLYYFVDRLIIL